jgi:hypothetical protein
MHAEKRQQPLNSFIHRDSRTFIICLQRRLIYGQTRCIRRLRLALGASDADRSRAQCGACGTAAGRRAGWYPPSDFSTLVSATMVTGCLFLSLNRLPLPLGWVQRLPGLRLVAVAHQGILSFLCGSRSGATPTAANRWETRPAAPSGKTGADGPRRGDGVKPSREIFQNSTWI